MPKNGINNSLYTHVAPAIKGYAVVLSLIITAFLFCLILTLSTFTISETQSSRQHMDTTIARRNAYFGLMQGLAELQRLAGPDQRVTASAETSDDAVGQKKHWIGVWDTASKQQIGNWLISSDPSPDPTTPINHNDLTNHVLLLSSKDPNDSIIAQKLQLTSKNGGVGKYAWWIADNGMKASITAADNSAKINSADYSTGPLSLSKIRNNAHKQIGQYYNIENEFQDEVPFRLQDPQTLSDLEKITSFNQLYLVNGIKTSSTYKKRLKARYHDYTFSNSFTLTNTLDGGLKQDLSHMKRLSNPTQSELNLIYNEPLWDHLSPSLYKMLTYYKQHPNQPAQIYITETLPNDPIRFSIHPIIPELVVAASIYCHSQTDQLYLYYYIFADVWNPYTKALKLNNGSKQQSSDHFNPQTDISDITIKVTGLPQISITNKTNGKTNKDLPLPDLYWGINATQDHSPGFMRPYSRPSSSYKGPNAGKGVISSFIAPIGYNAKTSDVFEIHFSTTNTQITISAKQPTGEFKEIQQINLKNIPPFTIQFENRHGSPNYNDRFVTGYSSARRSKINANNWSFGFHGKFIDEWNSVSNSLENLLNKFDMRSTQINIDMSDPTSGDGQFYDVRNINDLDRSQMMSNTDFFRSGGTYWRAPYRMARFYDLPNQEAVSIGCFSHLQLQNHPPFSIGNESDQDENINRFFDRYFFSTLPVKIRSWNKKDALPNTSIIYFPSQSDQNILGSEDSAKQLMIKNGFNVNSLSVHAWQALLSATYIKNFSYTQQHTYKEPFEQSALETTIDTLDNIDRAFFNFPFHAGHYLSAPNAPQDQRYNYIPPNNSNQFSKGIMNRVNHESFLQGFRELTSIQISKLAEAIVQSIKKWTHENGPFKSISEFLNSGVIKQAIANVPSINKPDPERKRIPHNSSTSISQSTLMNTLAPYLFTRSDTFTIRAYGEVISPHTQEIKAVSYCEGTVQRTPTDTSTSLGRKFRLTAFKWLTADDI